MNVKSGITIVASSVFVPTKTRNCGSRRCRKPQFLLVAARLARDCLDNSQISSRRFCKSSMSAA